MASQVKKTTASSAARPSPVRRGAGNIFRLLLCAAKRWSNDNASILGAALAFYCAFSLAPLLVLLVSALGWFVGAEQAFYYIGYQLTELFGPTTAEVLVEAAKHAQSGEGILATVVSAVTLVVGASTVFSALENALELIWGSQAHAPQGIKGFIRNRLLSFGFLLAVGFLLLVSLTLSTGLAALQAQLGRLYPGWMVLAGGLDFILSTALSASLFALAFRYMPATRITWRLAGGGALVTALLFQLGRWAIGLYLGRATQPSAFGAASSFVALLLWLYYSAQIFLYGAEFTSCLAGMRAEDGLTLRQRKVVVEKRRT